jgi:hypothetical protein
LFLEIAIVANPFTPPSAISGFNADPPSDDGQETSNNSVSWQKHLDKIGTPLKTYVEALGTAVNTAFATVDNASNLTQGELDDDRLSDNVPLKDAANVFTGGAQEIQHATDPRIILDDTDAGSDKRVVDIVNSGGSYLVRSRTDADGAGATLIQGTRGTGTAWSAYAITATVITLNGVNITDYARKSQSTLFTASGTNVAPTLGLSCAQPILSLNETDAATDNKLWTIAAIGEQFRIGAVNDAGDTATTFLAVDRTGTTVDTINFPSGTLQYGGSEVLTTSDEGSGNGLDADTVDGIEGAALRDAQINDQDGDYTLVLTDAGKTIYKDTGGSGETITIPANSSVAFPLGTMVTFVNRGGDTLTIAIDTDTLQLAGSTTTGNRTLVDGGVATALKVASTVWMISGSGLT